MTTAEQLLSNRSSGDYSGSSSVIELINTKQYEQAAKYLYNNQITSEQAGDTTLAAILAVARLICLACRQCQADTIWHQHASKESSLREHELEKVLITILKAISCPDLPGVQQEPLASLISSTIELDLQNHTIHQPGKPLSILQHIQKLLTGWVNSEPSEPVESVTSPPTINNLQVEKAPEPTSFNPKHNTASNEPVTKTEEQHHSKSPSFDIYCLGPFRIYWNDQPLDNWSSRKCQAVFKYLVTYRHSPVAKDVLMDIFWPDADPEAARRNLHQAIYNLRQTLKLDELDTQFIQFENDCYRLNEEVEIWLDYEEFEQHVQAGQQLERTGAMKQAMAEYGLAEGLYQGDFMAEDLYEEWLQTRRENLRQTYFSIDYRLAEYYLDRGEYAAAIALSQRALDMDNCQEEAHQYLIRCYLAQGQRHLAIRQYQFCAQALKSELDLSPSPEMRELYEQIAGD